MEAAQKTGVVASGEAAAESRSGKPTPDRHQANDGGVNDAVNRLLAAKGIAPAEETPAGADTDPEAEVGEVDLSQQQDETGSLAAAPDAAAEDQQEGEETEAEEDSGEEQEDAQDDAPKGVQKRINKLTARAKAAEEQVEELRRQIEEIKAAQAKPSEAATEGADPEVDAITGKLTEVRKELGIAEQLRAQLATDAAGVAEVLKRVAKLPNYEPETMRDWLNDYLGAARSNMARLEGQLETQRKVAEGQIQAKREQVTRMTETAMPWIKDKADPRHVHYQRIMATPAAKSSPDAAFFIAAGVQMLAAMAAREKAEAAKPKAKPAATVRPTARGGGAPAKPATKDPLQAARDGLAEGKMDNALAYAKAAVGAV